MHFYQSMQIQNCKLYNIIDYFHWYGFKSSLSPARDVAGVWSSAGSG